jgi:hypothetical protein
MSTFTRKWADFKPDERATVSDTPKEQASKTSESPTSYPFAGFAGSSVGHPESFSPKVAPEAPADPQTWAERERANILYRRLKERVILGTGPEDSATLLDYLRRAEAGDEEARAAVDDYLKNPAVIQALKAG